MCTHSFSYTVHYCRSSMPRLSLTCRFQQNPSFRQAQSALIGQWYSAFWLAEHHKPCRKCNAPYHNCELQLSKLKTVNNLLSFTISSNPKEEQSCMTDSDDARMCFCTQAAIKTISDALYTPLWCDSLSLSLSLSLSPLLSLSSPPLLSSLLSLSLCVSLSLSSSPLSHHSLSHSLSPSLVSLSLSHTHPHTQHTHTHTTHNAIK